MATIGTTVGLYKGFSFWQYEKSKSFSIMDIDCVNRDLLNHIFTPLAGRRVMMPGFGTRIPLMLMEPMDATTLGIIETDMETVINFDPRVELVGNINITASPQNKSVYVAATLNYIELNLVDIFDINLQFQN